MRGIQIGTVLGIPIRLGITFLFVLPLFAFLIATDVANLVGLVNQFLGSGTAIDPAPLSAPPLSWALGAAAAIGLFVGVLLHEFGHSIVAMRYGYGIESITLWLLGGLARFETSPENWRHEFAVAIAGPLVSVGVGVTALGAYLVLPPSLDAARFVVGYLALMNVALAVFNMLPAFPMDGGRVLRALLGRTRTHAESTRIAAEVGKGFAFLMGIVGLFSNLWLIVLAFFIYMGASGEAQQTALRAAFEGVRVADVMTPGGDLHTISPDASVGDLTRRMFSERHTGYPVIKGDDLVGMITVEDAQSVREVERDAYTVGEVMATDVTAVSPDAEAIDALERMQREDIGRLPVVDERGDLVGIVSRSDLMTALDIIRSTGSTDGVSDLQALRP